jgi:hypothetical protein
VIVTLIFWVMDKHFTQFPDRWDPRKPYGMRHPAFTISEDGPRIPRAKSASQLVAMSVALVWLRAARYSPFLIFGPAAAFLHLSPEWNQLYLPISALILLEMINAGVTLVRPDWVRFHWLMRIVGNVGNLIVAFFLITRGKSVVMVTLSGTPNAAHVAQIVNQTISFCVWFAVVAIIVQLAKNVRRLTSSQPAGAPAAANPLR